MGAHHKLEVGTLYALTNFLSLLVVKLVEFEVVAPGD